MNMNAFFRKLWQSREDQRAQEQRRAQEREDQARADAERKARDEAERRAAAAEAADIEASIQREADEDRERPLPPQSEPPQSEQRDLFDPSPAYEGDGINVVFDDDPSQSEQSQQDPPTFTDGSPVSFDYQQSRNSAQAPREVENAGHSAPAVTDGGEFYRATYLREIDDESRARMRYEREQEAAGAVLGDELENQYLEQATREWLGEGQAQAAPAQEVTGLEQAGIEQPVPEPSQTPAQPQAAPAQDLDDELEME